MNTLRKNLVIALTVLGMGSATFAVQAHEGHPANMEQKQAKRAEHMAQRQVRLHDALKLTAAQEPAWSAFQAAWKPGAGMAHGEHAKWAALPAPQRMEQRIALARQHIAAMETRLEALRTFYAVLTPEQKKVFDDNTMRRGHRMRHGHKG
ncbi:MAG: Spy/CpxP family protein refolding chaperone [Telluria sp.]